jgi:hypothetical protein
MPFTERYVDGDIGNDTYDGTSPTDNGGGVGPWKTIFGTNTSASQKQTAGMRINVKKATAAYKCSSILLTHNDWSRSGHYGTVDAPIVWRGYETTPGDDGKAEIQTYGPQTKGIVFTTNPGVVYFQNLNINGNTGNYGHLFTLNDAVPTFINCILRNTYGSSNLSYGQIFGGGNWIRAYGCTFITSATHADHVSVELDRAQLIGCFVLSNRNGVKLASDSSSVINCVLAAMSAGSKTNLCYGLYSPAGEDAIAIINNNVFANFYDGIYYPGGTDGYLSNNLFVDNTNALRLALTFLAETLPMFNNKLIGTGNVVDPTLPTLQMEILNAFETVSGTPLVDKAGYDFRPALVAAAADIFEDGFPSTIGGGYTTYDAHSSFMSAGPYAGHDWPAAADVRLGTEYRHSKETGTLDLPVEASVRDGLDYDGATKTGTMVLPDPEDVRLGTLYDSFGDGEQMGTLDLPAEANVQDGVQYDNLTKTGTLDVEVGGTVPRDITFEDNSDVA